MVAIIRKRQMANDYLLRGGMGPRPLLNNPTNHLPCKDKNPRECAYKCIDLTFFTQYTCNYYHILDKKNTDPFTKI